MRIQKIFAKIGFKYSSLFVLILLIFAKGSIAQDDVIRVDTNLVSIPVTVLDRDGRYVTNLKKEDFQISEDGVEQDIEIFETNEQPFTVMLLLDGSGSMNNFIPVNHGAVILSKQQNEQTDKFCDNSPHPHLTTIFQKHIL